MVSLDEDALIALYRSTGGKKWFKSWHKKKNWGSSAKLSTWYGVEVNQPWGQVIKLSLRSNNLKGEIPLRLGNLFNLETLDLGNNELIGCIPHTLGNLKRLQKLDLSSNQLQDPIPHELGKLPALTDVDLMGNDGISGKNIVEAWSWRTSQQRQPAEQTVEEELDLSRRRELARFRLTGVGGSRSHSVSSCPSEEKRNEQDVATPPSSSPTPNQDGRTSSTSSSSASAQEEIQQEEGPARRTPSPRTDAKHGDIAADAAAATATAPGDATGRLSSPGLQQMEEAPPVPLVEPDSGATTGQATSSEGAATKAARAGHGPPTRSGEPGEPKDAAAPSAGRDSSSSGGGQTDGAAARGSSPTQGGQGGGELSEKKDLGAAGRRSVTSEEEKEEEYERGASEHSFRAQVAPFAELDELTRGNHEALKEVKRLLEQSAAAGGGCSPPAVARLPDAEKLRELDRLVALAMALDAVASKHMEDEDMQRKERAFSPMSKAYYAAVRTGLCNAYLAASVVGSNLVRTSKTGGMGMAGEALKLLSGAVPVVGGLASFAAAAAKAGDRHIQTRRVVRITDMASDAVECCKLARKLALRLTDRLVAGTLPTSTTGKAGASHLHTIAGIGAGTDRSGWSEGGNGGASPGGSEEEFLEWFVEEVADCDPDGGAVASRARTPEEKAGRKLGKRHLHTLLDALGRDCLQGASDSAEKVERLLRVVASEAGIRPAETPAAPQEEERIVRAHVPASPPRELSVDHLEAELGAMRVKLEAALEESGKLKGKVEAMEKRIAKPAEDFPSDLVDDGGGLAQLSRRDSQTPGRDWQQRAESEDAANQDPATQAQMRELEAITKERIDELSASCMRLEAQAEDRKRRGCFVPGRGR